MCSERDSTLKRLYRRTHAKLTRLAGSGQLDWAAGCELSLALVHARARHPRQYFGWPRRAKRGRPITHEWIDPWTLLLPGQHRWAQVGATDEPREFRLARSRQDKRLERAIPLTTHLWVKSVFLIVTKFRSDMMSHCSVVADLKYTILQWTNKDPVTIFTCLRERHLWQCPDE